MSSYVTQLLTFIREYVSFVADTDNRNTQKLDDKEI